MSEKTKVAQRLREQCEVLRFRPIPLNHMIPVMQEAADALDAATATEKRLREALERLCTHFPTDNDMLAANWEHDWIDSACSAYENARAALQE